MTETADIVIIGGGCHGTSIAMQLAKRGAGKVVLLEKSHLAAGSTGRSSAVVRQHYSNWTCARMARRSLEIFQHFDEIVGGECGFVKVGYLAIVGEEDRAALEGNVGVMREAGVNVAVLDRETLDEIAPGIRTDDLAQIAAWEPDAGYADPALTTNSFARRARDYGAEIRQYTEVTGIHVVGGRVTGISTTKGDISTRTVICCAGPWSARVGRMAGIEIPVVPQRQVICTFYRPNDFKGPYPIISDRARKGYYRPDGTELALVGSSDPLDGLNVENPDDYDQTVSFETVARFSDKLSYRVPAMEKGSFQRSYTGLYEVTPDKNPVVGRVPEIEGFYLNCGWSGHGFKHSPVMGELMAEYVLDGRSQLVDLDFFRPTRFAEGKPIVAKYTYKSVFGYY